jgi:hypothetical protein
VNSVLQELDLFRNNIGESGAAAIAEALKVNSTLQQLDLRWNAIGSSGAAAIAEALKVNSSLQELCLGCNAIGSTGAAAIAEALKVNASLQKLCLRGNYMGCAGAAAIEESLERLFLGLEQNLNAHFPEVLLNNPTRKHCFLYAICQMGFRSFVLTDVPPALWPHALAKVSTYPSLIFHLLLDIPGSLAFW